MNRNKSKGRLLYEKDVLDTLDFTIAIMQATLEKAGPETSVEGYASVSNSMEWLRNIRARVILLPTAKR